MSTREEWLSTALDAVLSEFALDIGDRDEVVLSVGHPAKQGRRVRLVDTATDVEGGRQVYVSPYVSDSAEVLALVLWAATEFAGTSPSKRKQLRARLGYADAARGVILPLGPLGERLERVATTLPTYPHVYTDPTAVRAATQTTRMHKATCEGYAGSEHEPYIVRLSRTQAERGLPYCGQCASRMTL